MKLCFWTLHRFVGWGIVCFLLIGCGDHRTLTDPNVIPKEAPATPAKALTSERQTKTATPSATATLLVVASTDTSSPSPPPTLSPSPIPTNPPVVRTVVVVPTPIPPKIIRTPTPDCPLMRITEPEDGVIRNFGDSITVFGVADDPNFDNYKLQFREYFSPNDNDNDDQWHVIGDQKGVKTRVPSADGRGYLGTWAPGVQNYPNAFGNFVLRLIVNIGGQGNFKRMSKGCYVHVTLK